MTSCAEVVAVGLAKGVSLSADLADERLKFCDSVPATMTSSMHHDLERGNRLELPWLSGGVVEFGAGLGVRTPLNRAISDILALYVSGTRQVPSSVIRETRWRANLDWSMQCPSRCARRCVQTIKRCLP
jgi:ketopantoate reductase